MSTEREDLIEKANSLNIEFHSNVKNEKLKELIAAAEGSTIAPPPAPAPVAPKPVTSGKPLTKREKIVAAKKKALATKIVTITNKDNRENDVMTTVSVSFENAHFGLSRNVPLDIPVEIEVALISIIEGTTMTLHKDEIVGGKRTGNRVPVTVKKFAVSYQEKTD